MHRDTFIVWGMRIVSFILVLVFALIFYWLVIDRSKPVVVDHGEVARYEQMPDGSWVVFVKWFGERKRLCWGTSKRWLTGSALLPLEDIPYPPDHETKPIGPYEWEVPLHIPAYFARTGHIKGAYRIRIFYACNPLQEYLYPIVVEPPPVPFELPVDSAAGSSFNSPPW
jgi:hypothetical protein